MSSAKIGENVQEVRKAFGTVGDYSHGTLLNYDNMTKIVDKSTNITGCAEMKHVFGYDFEGFSKTATESGLNLSDRALNVSIQMNYVTKADEPVRLDTFAMCDCLLYIGIDGSISTRI